MRTKEALKMDKYKNGTTIIEKVKAKIYDPNYKMSNRISPEDFTRERKMPFSSLILFMLNIIKQTLQKELTNFMNLISRKDNITKSAFSQSRIKLKPEAFVELNEVLINEFYTDNIIQKWNGFRLCAIDGSTISLPYSKDILETFSSNRHPSNLILPMAQISSFYDVLNEIIINSTINNYYTGEFDLAITHIKKAKLNDLILFDRGYCAIWLCYLLLSQKINFVIRAQQNFISEIDSFWNTNKMSTIIEITRCPNTSKDRLQKLGLTFKPIKIRLVKVKLDNENIEVLLTSLLDEEEYQKEIFKDLYFMRWGIEVNYDHLKNNLQLENFTGLSSIAIKQDFFASMFITNIQTILARDAQFEMEKEKKNNRRKYKINRNLSLGFMKDRIVNILMNDDKNYMEDLKRLFQMEPVPIRKGRKFPRIFHRSNKKYHMNKKKAV